MTVYDKISEVREFVESLEAIPSEKKEEILSLLHSIEVDVDGFISD